ncbi:MAG: ABC transporter substrate-binding protein [Bacteroidetes bacterium]|nr:ABC transporter substrate-binding protein [Bacteroidota bacterium]
MIKHFRNTLYVLLFFPILHGINGCQNVDKLKFSNYFFYNEDQNVNTLDPAFARAQSEIWVISQMYEGLVEFDDNLNICPNLAKNWEVSDSGKTYLFHLRTDVFFHAVGPFKNKPRKMIANDVVYSFRRIADPATASPGAWVFNDKMDLRCFDTNDSIPFPVTAINDSTLKIQLTHAFKPFLGILAMYYCFVVPKEAVGKDFRSRPIGTGPFQFVKWEEEVAILMTKNNLYYRFENGKRLPYLDGIMVENVKNKQTAFMKFIQGEYDFFNGVDATIKDEMLDKKAHLKPKYSKSFNLVKAPFLNTEYLGFNIGPKYKNHPLSHVHIRKAINFAIDRKKMIAYLRNGVGMPETYGFVPAGMPGYPYNNLMENVYNIDSAKWYIKASGLDLSQSEEIVINTTQDYLELMIFVQKEMQKIGLKVRIEVHPSSFLRQLKKEQQINCFRGSWIADYPDPENYLICFKTENFSPNGPNYFHFSNARYDALFKQANAESDNQKRLQIMAEAEKIMQSEMPCIILYYDESLRLTQNWIEGLHSNPINFLRLRHVKKSKSNGV